METIKNLSFRNFIVWSFILVILCISKTYSATRVVTCTMAEMRLCDVANLEDDKTTPAATGAPDIKFNIDDKGKISSTFGGTIRNYQISEYIDSIEGKNNQFASYAPGSEGFNNQYFTSPWLIRRVLSDDITKLPNQENLDELKAAIRRSPNNFRFIDGWVVRGNPRNMVYKESVHVNGIFRCTKLQTPEEVKARETKEEQCHKEASGDKVKEKSCSLM